MMECLPQNVAIGLSGLNNVRELRIRNDREVKVNVGGKWYFLGTSSLISSPKGAIRVGNICDDIVKKACNNSIYAYEKSLSNGYFTLDDGVRVGVCGPVFGKDKHTFQKYTSLCFRVPHKINVIDNEIFEKLSYSNIIVIGKPGSGKTTFLRDFAKRLSSCCNVLVADERGELFYDDDVGMSDVLKWTSKAYAFEIGVRAMSPDYIICDELEGQDSDFVTNCVNSGVKICCSAHGSGIDDVKKRFGVLSCFDYAVLLKADAKPIIVSLRNRQAMTAFVNL